MESKVAEIKEQVHFKGEMIKKFKIILKNHRARKA
jgi:hypothetical protein